MKLPTARVAAIFFAALPLSPWLAADDVCQTFGSCYLPCWTPDEAEALTEYGHAVDIEGDTAVVSSGIGAPVAVYERVDGSWSHTQSLPDPSGLLNEGYGFDLALSGDWLAVGSPRDGTMGYLAGAVHMFQRVGGTWTFYQTLYDPLPAEQHRFGYRLALSGPWLAVSMFGTAPNEPVYTFFGTAGGWGYHEILDWIDTGSSGTPIAIHVDPEDVFTVRYVVGVPNRDVDGMADAGAAYIYLRTLGLSASQIVYHPEPDPQDRFGFAVDFDGERLVIGATSDDEVASGAGAAYVFDYDPEAGFPATTLDQKLLPCITAGTGAYFGFDVAIEGDRIAVGSVEESWAGTHHGAAYVFGGNIHDWQVESRVRPDDVGPLDQFGHSVALDGDAFLVGSRYGDAAGAGSGGAYFVSLSSSEVPTGPCPCETLAEVESYGLGKPGSVGVPELAAKRALVPGESTNVGVSGALVGASPIFLWGVVPAAVPFDEGTLWMADLHIVPMPIVAVTGASGLTLPVPEDLVLCGVEIHAQAMFLDPGASGPYSTAQTNALRMLIGY